MNELVKVDPKEFGLEESKANELTKGLTVILEEREVLIKSYVETIELEITEENLPVFKELRLKIRDNRTKGIEPWHKVNKQFFLTGGRFVDAIKNKEVLANEQMESKLMDVEKYFENIEKERLEALTLKRFEECIPLVEDHSLIPPDLGAMPVSLWDNYIIGLKASFETRKKEEKRIEDERLAAEKAKIERQKAIEAENNRLKKEAKQKEVLINKRNDELKPYIVFIRDYNTLLNSNEADYSTEFEDIKKGAQLQWEHDRKEAEKIRIENEKIEAERKQKEKKLQAEKDELNRKIEAQKAKEEKALKDSEALKQAELNKGDEVKIEDLITDLKKLKTAYSFKSDKNKSKYLQVGGLLDKVIDYINK